MKRNVPFAVASALAVLSLAGCESEQLSIGELRCAGVSCEGLGLDHPSRESSGLQDLEALPDLHAEHALPIPCEVGPDCGIHSVRMVLLERDGAPAPVVAAHLAARTGALEDGPDSVENWLWIGRPTERGWEGQASFSLGRDGQLSLHPIALALDRERPDRVIATIAALTDYASSAHTLHAFRYGADDQLEPLFEDASAGATHDAVMIGDDLLVIDEYGFNFEIARYGLDGEMRWRQTALEEAHEDGPESDYDRAQIALLDGERIAALIPTRLYSGGDVVLLSGDGELQHRYRVDPPIDAATGLYLDADVGGDLVVGVGGYQVERYVLDERDHAAVSVRRERTEYHSLHVYAIDVAASGWTYVATQDGLFEERVELLERVSHDLGRIESMRLVSDAEGECASLFYYGGEQLEIDADERTAYVTSVDCFAQFALPPVE